VSIRGRTNAIYMHQYLSRTRQRSDRNAEKLVGSWFGERLALTSTAENRRY
jgi:hypothetical protein